MERLLAIQSQDGRGMRLAIRPRSRGVSVADLEKALTEDRTVVVSWLNRGTLHLVGRDEFPWLHALTVPRLATSNRTRLKQEGVTAAQAERGADLIVRALGDGPKGRDELKAVLDDAGVPTAKQALVHILLFTTIRDTILRGPVIEGDQKFALAEDWLGGLPEFDSEVALAELARRYLAGHGPATDRELARWAGIPLGQARKGIASIAGELEELNDEGTDVHVRLAKAPAPGPLPPPRLLGSFDPVLHGWTSREFLIPAESERAVVTTNGIFRPTILVDGQVAGTWTMSAGIVELNPFRPFGEETQDALEKETKRVKKYLAAPS